MKIRTKILLSIFIGAIILGGYWFLSSYKVTVVDETVTIPDKEFVAFSLKPGEYTISIDSDVDVNIRFIGGGLPYSKSLVEADEVKHYKRYPTLSESATLKIINPAILGLGQTATAHVKVTKEGII